MKKERTKEYHALRNFELKEELRRIMSLFVTTDEIETAIREELGIPSPIVLQSEADFMGRKKISVTVFSRCGELIQV